MINTKDQEALFELITKYLEDNITCIAIGGTAMMFSKYKNATKDIDLVFKNLEDRDSFIKAIKTLGYKKMSLTNIYDEKRTEDKNTPLMYTRGEERFDLFVGNVFGYKLNFSLNSIMQRNDFLGKKELIIYILSPEDLILLKAITSRERDFEDIETILEYEKDIDFKSIVIKAISQKDNNSWILIDLEETLQKLRKKHFIKQEVFDMIYEAQSK